MTHAPSRRPPTNGDHGLKRQPTFTEAIRQETGNAKRGFIANRIHASTPKSHLPASRITHPGDNSLAQHHGPGS